MSVYTFILEHVFYGLCLGAVFHIQVWYMSKGLNWATDALTGERLK